MLIKMAESLNKFFEKRLEKIVLKGFLGERRSVAPVVGFTTSLSLISLTPLEITTLKTHKGYG